MRQWNWEQPSIGSITESTRRRRVCKETADRGLIVQQTGVEMLNISLTTTNIRESELWMFEVLKMLSRLLNTTERFPFGG